ncbi:NTP transferase domain-containing protein [Roseomonas populi]|uniref:NTP transferase domain-containing protein n=1 Tax=Roseomonas populi TaxID=3121582 RepID=A0ABT1WZ07_9PROT|nr:NTP transferase domain-containing protein [Roseomonas pecuniae]MCR0981083.1 NTP transferase domain-containing protein [Roseomonas pecuniae]
MTDVTALVLAGQRRGTDPMAAAAGVSHKALLPVAGVPMLLRVLAALRGAPGIGRVVVSIEEPGRALAGLAGLDGVILRPSASSPARSAAAVFEEFGAPLLVTTADHALLTPDMVEHVLRAAPPGASAVAALARRERILAEFPDTRRTWLRFRDGAFSGCNLFLLARPEAARVLEFWQRLEAQRKRPLTMARMLGLGPLLSYALGRMTLRGGLDALGARCRAPVAVVEMPFGAAAVDVDKPDDLVLVEARLSAGRDPRDERG